MKRIGFEYRVALILELSEDEAQQILAACKWHYDGTVKAAAKVGGVAYGIANRFEGLPERPKTVEVTLKARDVDLLVKALEEPRDGDIELQSALWFNFFQALAAAGDEARRLRDSFCNQRLGRENPLRYDRCGLLPGHSGPCDYGPKETR